ncbi:MAG: putative porin [Bacteroidota bacterium]
MTRIFPALLITALLLSPLSAQTADTTQAKKDSVIHYTPIPELGSIEPFGDPSISIRELDITLKEYRSLYDVIAREPGVFMRDLASPGQPNQIVINGIDDRNIAVMVDGVPYNDHYSGSFNLWNIPVEEIERVEFITGSSSMFYDGRSAGGVINIVTKNFNNNRAITKLRISQGTSGYSETDVSFAQNIANGLNLSFALSHYGFGSNKEYQSYRARFNNSNDDSWMIRSRLRYNITDWLDLSLSYTYDRSWTGLFGGVDYYNSNSIFDGLLANVLSLESYQKQFNSHYNLTAAFYPFQDSTVLTSFTVYSFDRLREYRNEENRSFERDSIYSRRDYASIGHGIKLNLMSQYSDLRFIGYADLARIQSTDILTAGLKAEILPQAFFTLTPFVTFKDYQHQFIANGGIDATLKLSDAIHLFGGIARNIINDVPVTVTTTRQPQSASEYSSAERTKETFSILEAGARFTIPGFTAHVRVQHTDQYDPVMFDSITFTNSTGYYHPAKFQFDVLTAGFHTSWNDFHLEGTASYLRYPNVTRNNLSLTLYPQITANGSLYFQGLLAKGALDLKIGIRGNFFSKQTGMRPYDEFGVWIPSSELTFGPSGSADLFIIGKIGDAYVHLIWENLGGNQFLLAPVYPVYDRNVRFGVSWEFLD